MPLERQDGLDEAVQARGTLRVADVGLYGANVDALLAKDVADGRCLDRVSRWRAGSMALGLR